MNAITYFKLNSPYPGDVTKNCALTGSEVDNNFYTLEGRDIKSVELSDDKIVVNLMNGEKLTTDSITENCIKDITINFDEVNGVLTIVQDGVTQTIGGFVTSYNNNDKKISVDSTIVGNGLIKNPVGISPVSKTGQYRPVKGIINVIENEKLPLPPFVVAGDRYLTIENINDYGYLYNYEGLKKIACKLKEMGSEWRIPTKEDWDDMLDAVEPCEEFRNHTDVRSNKFLGKFAGKFLKSVDFWKRETQSCNSCGQGCSHEENNNENDNDCHCGRPVTCHPDYCGEYGHCRYRHNKDNSGVDKYGFRVVPAGYANEAKDYMYFQERAYFWTASNHEYRDAYIKAFTFDRSSVLQDIIASDNYLSVRLVKDYDGTNFKEHEDILGGVYSTVLMPSMEHGNKVWTSMNIALAECGCDCCAKYVLPNNGQGMENQRKYFTNEWTGREWLRKELVEGESVVVTAFVEETSEQGTDYKPNYTEYRVVNGELVDVSRIIYDNVMESLQENFEQINNDIVNLQEGLEAEITRSTTKDEEHEATLNDLNERLSTAEENLQGLDSGLAEEIAAREAKDIELEAKDAELEGKILTEDGTLFDEETGVLTLKSKDGTNDIEVQFGFNFGTF